MIVFSFDSRPARTFPHFPEREPKTGAFSPQFTGFYSQWGILAWICPHDNSFSSLEINVHAFLKNIFHF